MRNIYINTGVYSEKTNKIIAQTLRDSLYDINNNIVICVKDHDYTTASQLIQYATDLESILSDQESENGA